MGFRARVVVRPLQRGLVMALKRDTLRWALAPLVASLLLAACGDGGKSYEDTGERMDDAVQRVERLKADLAEAEAELEANLAEVKRLREELETASAELRAASGELREAAERAPTDVGDVPVERGG